MTFKTIKELEAMESLTEVGFAHLQALKDVLELIDERIEHYDLKLDTSSQVCLTQLKIKIQGK